MCTMSYTCMYACMITVHGATMNRPGPIIPFNLPIIQELYSLISTPLFKRKSPIILKKKLTKMQMKHECDQNVHIHV